MSSFFKIFLAAILAAMAGPAYSQALRTWVSGVGDDVNPCSRTAPCKTFAGAISKTAAGGEINCLDPGGFGALTITRSITVDCSGTFGSVLNSGGINGIVVNDSLTAAPGTIEVILRGISIDGAGTTPGLNGIRFISGRSLVLEDVFIQNQNGGSGIALEPTRFARFAAENVTVTDGQRGILIQPTGATGALSAVLRNVRVQNNSGIGLRLTGALGPQGVTAVVDKSSFSANGTGVSAAAAAGTTATALMLADSVVASNRVEGISASGAAVRVRVGNSTISGNATGVTIAGGALINSYGTNRLDGNATDGTFSAPIIPQR